MSEPKERRGVWRVTMKDGDDYEYRIEGYPYADGGFLRADLEGGGGVVAYAQAEIVSWELTFDE